MTEYRQGYTDARDLIVTLESTTMARLACPPAMPEEYRQGFIKACDDAEKRHRPNNNYILSVMRDGDMDDPWGTAMSMAFAVAECLTVISADVPEELGFEPSPYVKMQTPEEFSVFVNSGEESYEHYLVWEYLAPPSTEIPTNLVDFEARIAAVQFAGRCLHRYIDWCRQAGRDY